VVWVNLADYAHEEASGSDLAHGVSSDYPEEIASPPETEEESGWHCAT
jgi:hypothetical protein